MSSDYKWPSHQIEQAFKSYNERTNLNKVRKFQRFTDDLDTCVLWCVNSIRNDREMEDRLLSHDTGAE